MKKFILLTAFIGLLFTPTFAQINRQLKTDTTFRDRSNFSYQNPFKLKPGDTLHFNRPLSGSQSNKYFRFPKFSERNFRYKQIPIDNLANARSYDRMICVRPEGYLPMPVAIPDSTIKYSMLIKRY
jgi:hypothetical protein